MESLDPGGCDVLVLAGDICASGMIYKSLSGFCEKFPRVLYVVGNHEYYFSDRGRVNTAVRKVVQAHSNFTFMENDIVNINGQRFLGTPLWYPATRIGRLLASSWSDFLCIKGFKNWVYEENAKAVTFFRREMREGDIAITHMLPTFLSVHPSWAGSQTNAFFVSDVEDLILERKPKLWIHGHSHTHMDVMVGSTRVVNNPFGYARGGLNPRFDDMFTIEI